MKIPEHLQKQLTDFKDSMFTVNSLFLNFESTDLVAYDERNTKAPEDIDVRKQFILMMSNYLKYLVDSGTLSLLCYSLFITSFSIDQCSTFPHPLGNPFVLGHTVSVGDTTRFENGAPVTDILLPAGTTYTMYHDPNQSRLSTLNFCLVTKGYLLDFGTPFPYLFIIELLAYLLTSFSCIF
jgi:hypothetical protein